MKKTLVSAILVFLFYGLLNPMYAVYPATSAIITVNSTLDVIDAEDNLCTLREAIIAANSNQPSGVVTGECQAGSSSGIDTINIPLGTYTLTIAGQNEDNGLQGDLDITSAISIQGDGPNNTIIQGGISNDDSVDRVFHVNTSSSVNFLGLTIQKGDLSGPTPEGGGILVENGGTITFDSCKVKDNKLEASIHGRGAGLANMGNATVSIANSTFYYNRVLGSGDTYGGGIYNAASTLNIANTTLESNITNGSGGGVYNYGTAYLSNVTLEYNWSDYNITGTGDGGGIASPGITYLKNSLLFNVDRSNTNVYPDIHGNVISADYNMFGNIGDANNFTPAAHDIVGDSTNPVYPDLGSYRSSAGSHQLLSTSLVLDQIPEANCTFQSGGSNPLFSDGEVMMRDQRGAPRPFNRYCDIGAREFYFLTVTSPEDKLEDDGECTLREAISTSNFDTPSGQTEGECIISPDGVYLPAGTYTLEIEGKDELFNKTGDLNIYNELILAGDGAHNTIIQAGPSPGSGIDRVIKLRDNNIVEIHNLTIRHGLTESDGAGLAGSNNEITLIDVSISDNNADGRGGGVYCDDLCEFIISGSSFVGNQSRFSDGGAIFVDGSSLTIANSTISGNQAAGSGGGISGSNLLYLSNVTVTSNSADSDQDGIGDGGGIEFFSEWYLKNSIIANNIDHSGEKPDVSNDSLEIPSLDYNLIGDLGLQEFTAAAHDLVGSTSSPKNPQLRELTGTPPYQVPEYGSQVIDAIPAVSCTYTSPDSNHRFGDGEVITSDQTMGIRPVDGDLDGQIDCDIGAVEYNQPELSLLKSVDKPDPRWTEFVNFTIAISNDGPMDATAAVISDTLPAGLNYVGPLFLHPAGTVLTEPILPTLAVSLTITSSETISLTFAASFDAGLAEGTQITNTAEVVSSEVSDPVAGSVVLTIAETPLPVFLPLVVQD